MSITSSVAEDWHDAYEPPSDLPAGARPPLGSERDYPYDPARRVEMQVGLDKLRCVADRAVAKNLYDLFWIAEANRIDPKALAWFRAAELEKQARELKRLEAVAERAFRGGYGREAKELAAHILIAQGYGNQRRTDEPSLREFESELKKLRGSR